MKTIIACFIVLSLGLNIPPANSENNSDGADDKAGTDLNALVGDLFHLNTGQIPHPGVVLHSNNAYFTPTGVIFRVVEIPANTHPATPPGLPGDGTAVDAPLNMHIFRTTFAGASPVIPFGREELPYRSNFFIGNDSDKWATDVPNYREIIYEGLYDGIDLVYRAMPDGLKYEFIVHPGADIADINILYEGADVRTDGENIFIDTTAGLVVDGGLEVFQPSGGGRESVEARIIVQRGAVSFDVAYDRSRELVIDPMIYSTFLGGGSWDYGNCLAMDPSDNAIVTGYTMSSDFPTTPGSYQTAIKTGNDIFVAKLNASGDRLLYSTYIGGSSGDYATSIAIDSSNNTVIGGYSESADFPTTIGAYDRTFAGGDDVVVFKLNSNGDGLLFSTFIGGQMSDKTGGLSLDSENIIYLTGGTTSKDFPITPGALVDTLLVGTLIFILKMSSAGDDLLFSTYYGQVSYNFGISIDTDPSGGVYVTGVTQGGLLTKGEYGHSYNGGTYDLIAIKVSSDGKTLDYAAYIGGSDYEIPARLEVNSSGYALISGYTKSTNFPTTQGAFNRTFQGSTDCFVLSLKPDCTGLAFSTLVGGTNSDWINSARTDAAGDIFATGVTYSSNFPMTSASEQETLQGSYDCFLIKLKSDGTQLAYSNHVGIGDAYWLELDGSGNPVATGKTESANFPTTKGAYDQQFNGLSDAFVFSWRLPTPPLNPCNLSAGPGDRQALLNWSAPMHDGYRPVLNYSIYRGNDPANLSKVASLGNVTKFTHTGLINGWKYFFAVSATNGVGEGNLSAVINVTPGAAPSKPVRPQAISGDRYVNLSWSKPDDFKGYPVLSYSIFKGLTPANLSLLTTQGNLTRFNDTSVSNGATYFYAISAINYLGESQLSDIINATPGRPPSAPTNLSAEIGYKYVVLKWDPPEDDGGYGIESYKIYQEEIDPENPVSDILGTTCTFNDLENGKTYGFSVSAVNLKGEGEKSDEIFVVPGSPPGAPSLKAQELNGQVALSWSITDDGGIPVTIFRIYKADKPNSDLSFYIETSKTSYDDLFVLNENTYYYAVSAVNSKGEGNRSSVISATPAGQGRLPGPPINLTGVAGDGYALISWNPPPDRGGLNDITYRVYKGTNKDALDFLMNVTGVQFNDTRVLNTNSYFYAISTVNRIGEGQKSAYLSIMPTGEGRTPGAPLDCSVTTDNISIILTWGEPSDYGGSKIINYNIYKGTDSLNLILTANTSAFSYADHLWDFGIRYYYTIRAVNQKGEGTGSETKDIAIFDVPSEVLNLSATTGDEFVLLTWHAPVRDGGSGIKEYQVYRAQGKTSLSLYKTVTDTVFNDTKVSNGFNYAYQIAAINGLGSGKPSSTINATPGAPPGVPLDFTVQVQNGKARLKWSPPSDRGGFQILEYRIFRGNSENDLKLLASVKEPTYLDNNVSEGKKYYYRISAVNEKGESPFSNEISIMIPETPAISEGTVMALSVLGMIIVIIAASLVLFFRRKKSK